MSLRVAFLERSPADGRWHIGSDVDDPELAAMTVEEWVTRLEGNELEVGEFTGARSPAFALWARRLAPEARVFAIYAPDGYVVALVWEATA